MWTGELIKAFTTTKDALTTVPVLSFYNASKPTHLCIDVSQQGFGFILQEQSNGGTAWNLIQVGSCFLTDVESWSTTIELEVLAICWAVVKCKLYLADLQHFSIVNDYNSLIPIIKTVVWREREPKPKLMAYNLTTLLLNG